MCEVYLRANQDEYQIWSLGLIFWVTSRENAWIPVGPLIVLALSNFCECAMLAGSPSAL